jgi:spore photoproduct lyase
MKFMKNNNIEKIYVKSGLENNNFVKNIIQKLNIIPEKFIEIENINLPFTNLKKHLILTEHMGNFLNHCPCTPDYCSCGYFVLETGIGCPFNCSYCFLQEYQNFSNITLYVNFDKMYFELDELLGKNKNKFFRIGTGEFTDSLFLDDITNSTGQISSFLRENFQNYLIEFKTKSTNIESLLKNKVSSREVISWSINPDIIIKNEEHFTPDLKSRLLAAKKCADYGYNIGFHFDPLIIFDNWEIEYEKTVNMIFDIIPKNKIVWISVGSLRFNARLKPIMELNHPSTKIIYEEMVKGIDGKLRYFKPLRIQLYKKIVEYIKKRDNKALIYFCMEDKNTWSDILNFGNNFNVNELFEKSWREKQCL